MRPAIKELIAIVRARSRLRGGVDIFKDTKNQIQLNREIAYFIRLPDSKASSGWRGGCCITCRDFAFKELSSDRIEHIQPENLQRQNRQPLANALLSL